MCSIAYELNTPKSIKTPFQNDERQYYMYVVELYMTRILCFTTIYDVIWDFI